MSRLKTWPQHLLPQHALTRLANAASNSRLLAPALIGAFSRLYPVQLDECEAPAGGFGCFDAFFTRALKPDARTFPGDSSALASPCDGTVSQIGAIEHGRIIQAKNRRFSVEELLGGREWAEHFEVGRFATIYLAPHDYHRVHMPLAGRLMVECRIPGRLFSVSASTSRAIDRLYARNERLVTLFETEYGPVAVVMVAALLVAGISTTWNPDDHPRPGKTIRTRSFDPAIALGRGDELGRFHWGSTVIVLTGKNAPAWNSAIGRDQRIQLGARLSE